MDYFSFNNNTRSNAGTGTATSDPASTAGAPSSGGGGLESFSQFASDVFSKENFQQVGSAAIEQVQELKQQTQDGDFSIKMLGLIGGLLLTIIGSLEVVHQALSLNLVGVFIELYTCMLGFIVIVLEGKKMFLTSDFIDRMHKYALFVKYLWGRGALYFVAGTLQLTQLDFLNYISGVYMCFLGIMFILIGQRTASKLRALKNSAISENTLRDIFNEASSTSGDGGLDRIQFRALTQILGMDMTRRETEAAFYYIPKQDSEKLSYQEFVAWWRETDVQDDTSFIFV